MWRIILLIACSILTIAGVAGAGAASAALTGAWRIATIDGAPPPGRAGVTLNFEPDGRVSGQAPCNRFHAGYRIEEDRVVFSAGALTRMFCGEDTMRAEQRFMNILGGGAAWRVEGDNLTLSADSGGVMTATRTSARRR